MNHLVVEGVSALALFIVSSLVLQGTGASGVITEAVINEYSAIVDEIETTLNLPQFKLLADAALMFDEINLNPAGHRQAVDLPKIIIDRLLRVHATQGGGKYADFYDKYVTKPCKQVVLLEDKFNRFLDRNPQINNDVLGGSIFILGDLPVLYEDIVELCEREYLRKRVQGQQEYDAIILEIDQLIQDTDQSVLNEAVRLLDLQSEQSIDLKQTMGTSKAIAELLLHVRKIRKVEDSDGLREFNNLFDPSVAQPCDRTIALATKLDSCLERYPQIDDVEHRHYDLPDYFHVVARICLQIKREGNQVIFDQFNKLKSQ